MITVQMIIEDGTQEELIKILHDAAFKAELIRENNNNILAESFSTYEKLKKIQEEIGDQQLLKNIPDASEWQREIRKEWDRDF